MTDTEQRQLVKRIVLRAEVDELDPPARPLEFILWLQKQVSRIPQEYRQDARIVFSAQALIAPGEIAAAAIIEIFYLEPENDLELKRRLQS